MMRSSLTLLSLFMLTACGEDTSAPAPPDAVSAPVTPSIASPETPSDRAEAITPLTLPSIAPKVTTKRKAEIDWASAREDLSTSGDGNVSTQSVGEEPANVPVLLPTGIVTLQSAGNGPVFRRTEDGYFAFYPGETYNIVVNGTNQVVVLDDAADNNPARAPIFTVSEGGAQVWLTRYGADYTVEFECNLTLDEESTCIDEATAMRIASNLIVSGSR